MNAYVNTPVLKLMIEPSRCCELADEALYGMKVEILETDGDWAKVKTPYRYTGWAEMSDLYFADAEAFEKAEKRVVLRASADLMQAPKVQSYPLRSVPRGAIVGLTGEKNEAWTQVVLVDGRTAWTRESFLGEYKTERRVSEAEFRRALVRTAESYLGTQYRWGGKTPQGIDCSGLCSMSYLLNGVFIYRDARIMPDFPIHEIEYSQIKMGDLLFFKGHVAMYIENGRFIHSTGHAGDDGVVYSSFNPDDPDYREDLWKGLLACGTIF